MDLLRFADHRATEITLIGVVQSWEGKRIETMMRSSKKRNNVGKCASCKFIYLSLITLGIKFLPLFLGTKRDNLRFFLSWNKLKSSKKSSTNPTILLSPIHFLLFLTSINYSSVRNIGESRSKSIRNLSNPVEKLRVPNLDDSSSECNGDASKRPTSRSTFSTLPRRSVIVSAIRFVAGNVVRVVRAFKNFVTFFREVETTRIPPQKSLISG